MVDLEDVFKADYVSARFDEISAEGQTEKSAPMTGMSEAEATSEITRVKADQSPWGTFFIVTGGSA